MGLGGQGIQLFSQEFRAVIGGHEDGHMRAGGAHEAALEAQEAPIKPPGLADRGDIDNKSNGFR